jgi:single-strand DNA-binding protein
MAGMAKVTLVGNLGQDAELKYTQNQTPVCNFSLAVNEKVMQNGQQVDRVQWFRCALWGKLGESLKQYLTKGKQVYVDGPLHIREYQVDGGEKRFSADVTVKTLQLLGSGQQGGGQQRPQGQQQATQGIPEGL